MAGGHTATAKALEALVPGLVSSLKPGRMRYSLLLAEDGGILDDLMITNTGETIALVVNGACKWDDIAFLREHLPDEITLTHHDEQALLARKKGAKFQGVVAKFQQQLQELHTQVAGAFALLLFSSCSRSLPVIAAALACECPQTRRK